MADAAVQDDEDSKTRRNLLAASTIILLLSWLDLPVSAVADRLFGTSVKDPAFKVDEWRIWTAAFVMLLYFAWRFRHSPQFHKLTETGTKGTLPYNMRSDVWEWRHGILSAVVGEYPQTQGSKYFNPSLDTKMREHWNHVGPPTRLSSEAERAKLTYRPPALRAQVRSNGGFHKGELSIEYTWDEDGMTSYTQYPKVGVQFNVGFPRTLWAGVRAFLRATLKTDAGVLLVLPVALAALAALVVFWRMYMAFMVPNISWCVLPIQG